MNTQPISPELRALVQPHIEKGSYPPIRVFKIEEYDALPLEILTLFSELDVLLAKQAPLWRCDSWPEVGTEWANIRQDMCEVLRKLLVLNPDLIENEQVQFWAIESGAIPTPNETGHHMEYFYLPDGSCAHWACGTCIRVEEHENGVKIPFCPTCESVPVRLRLVHT